MSVTIYQRNQASSTVTTLLDTTITHLGVGSDATAPVIGDTTLGTETYREAKFSSNADVTKYEVRLRLDTTENNGNTINELGIFNAVSGGTMYFRNLTTTFIKTNVKEAQYLMSLTFTFSGT